MKTVKMALVAFAGLSVALGLSGCINLLPKTKPVQLYRFGYDAQTLDKAAVVPAGSPVGLTLGTVMFPAASAGDGILTVEGHELSYVAQARWATGAQAMFTSAVSEGFARSGGNLRLDPRGPSGAAYRLDLSVRHFESVYTRGKPTVTVSLDARITRLSDRAVMGERFITSDIGVGHNDMALTVDAYNEATSKVVAALIGFTEETLAPLAAPPTPMTEMPKDGKQKVEGL